MNTLPASPLPAPHPLAEVPSFAQRPVTPRVVRRQMVLYIEKRIYDQLASMTQGAPSELASQILETTVQELFVERARANAAARALKEEERVSKESVQVSD